MANVPPLRIWLYTLILAISMIAVLLALRLSAQRESSAAYAAHAQQFLASPANQARVRVVALGTSLLWAASPPNTPASREYTLLRMTKTAQSFGPLRPVLEVLDQHPPDILIIEANLRYPPSADTAMDEMRQSFIMLAKDIADIALRREKLAGPALLGPLSDQRMAFSCEIMSPSALRQQLPKLAEQHNVFLSDATVDASLRDQLLRLSRRGVHIVVLELQRSAQFEQRIAVEKQRWQQRWRTALAPAGRISYLSSPTFTEADSYCDARHLSGAGARRFAPWWASELQHLVRER